MVATNYRVSTTTTERPCAHTESTFEVIDNRSKVTKDLPPIKVSVVTYDVLSKNRMTPMSVEAVGTL